MAARWSVAQVRSMAPDARSFSAARALAAPATWSGLGATESLLWGRCQGSAAEPYAVTIELAGPGITCSCPSRKQPCKHGLALLLLWVEHGDAVAEVEGSAAPVAAGPARAGGPEPSGRRSTVADPEAQARREAKRVETMTAGFAELDRWLADLVRQGLATARRQPYAFWDTAAARLVDAQLPALAERVRAVGEAVQAREDWAELLVTECGRWHLAGRAWDRREALPEATVGDLRAFVGWPRRGDEVAGFERLRDSWVVAGLRQGEDGRIVSQRTWLWGTAARRWVLVLDFAASAAALRVAHVVGSLVEDEVVLHPGSAPQRAAFSGEQVVVQDAGSVEPAAIAAALDALTAAQAANPWRDRVALALAEVTALRDAGRWWLVDPAGDRLPLAPDAEPWPLLALTGGRSATVVVEWEDAAVHPLSVVDPDGAGTLVPL